ncbi:MAG: replicative DNA helicase [Candidatus Liptonbacteria bacterium CG11_big_fil_rev_8_21_14_0_20_35_14]|uniref:Replicative DNA helicase n=1 Tax=Candidatus Liptonbacteria bacterium CG11_big_fil_rev_8_21_14_0_20_35_14 TaxID=1974634 RepID=A0A2H0N7I1_9BACT|nr:MAG: replicative DNA helicase [Candidatus Liptonbacteria bacterium CG11_big_fil_rev_8_21_14_0_20_35_14]
MAKNIDNLKIPPQNIEAERFVLGSLMIDKNAIYKVADIIDYGDFYHPIHSKIFRAIFELFGKSSPIDVISVSNFLKEKGTLTEIGGASYLSELVAQVSTASHVEHYANAIKDKKLLRDLISLSEYLHEKATQNNDDIDELLDSIEQKILAISQRSTIQRFVNIKDELQGAYNRIEKLHQKEGTGLRGVPTGFTAIDNMLSGLQPSDLIILGARPSVGKTSLALNIASQAAKLGDKPVGIFSLEMSREQITERFLSTESGIPLWRLRTGRIHNDDEFMVIQNALDKLSNVPLFIDDTPSPTVLQIRSMARRLQMEHGLGFVIIDYLQLITSRIRSDNVVQQVAEISRGLKGLARELNIPVLALSQLSRGLESRDSKVPKLSDLRDSGSIEQDADVVLFIHRKGKDNPELPVDEQNITDIIIAKHRNGPTGTVKLRFDPEKASFFNIDKTHSDDDIF